MKKTFFSKIILALLLPILCFGLNGCTSDEGRELTPQNPDNTSEDNTPPDMPAENYNDNNVAIIRETLMDDNLVLVNDARNNEVFILDKNGNRQFQWNLTSALGNDCYLLPDGNLLALLEAPDPKIKFGGFAGLLQLVKPDNQIEWEFSLSSNDAITHHDVEMLPNGNVLALVWERIDKETAQENGFVENYDIYTEAIIEYNPNLDQVVWEWRSFNHIVQDDNSAKPNYGIISNNKDRININYNLQEDGDIMHANAITYDPVNDLIYISVNFFSEVWVIDHNTTIEEAKGDTGGAFNKGGRLLYRFGNPETYDGNSDDRLFHNNHYPNLINSSKNLLIFNNGNNNQLSEVLEFQLPPVSSYGNEDMTAPNIVWKFDHPDLYSSKVSGAVRLKNGNTLIAEGDFGYWEVTSDKKIVWKYKKDGFYWRGYSFYQDDTAIKALGL